MPSYLLVPETATCLDDIVKYKVDSQEHLLDSAARHLHNADGKMMMTAINLQQSPDKTWELVYVVDSQREKNPLVAQWFPLAEIKGSAFIVESNPRVEVGTFDDYVPDPIDGDARDEKSEDASNGDLPTQVRVVGDMSEIHTDILYPLLGMQHGALLYSDGTSCVWPGDRPFGNTKEYIDRFLSYGYMLFIFYEKDSKVGVNKKATEIYRKKEIRGDALFVLQVDERIVSLHPSELDNLLEISKMVDPMTEMEAFQIMNEQDVKNRFKEVEAKRKRIELGIVEPTLLPPGMNSDGGMSGEEYMGADGVGVCVEGTDGSADNSDTKEIVENAESI
jgi:hypothetical protein